MESRCFSRVNGRAIVCRSGLTGAISGQLVSFRAINNDVLFRANYAVSGQLCAGSECCSKTVAYLQFEATLGFSGHAILLKPFFVC